MSDLTELYQEVILDHNRHPQNFRIPEAANRKAEGYNPLCGDQITVYVRLEDGIIKDIGFQGNGCAISKASGSMMTQGVKGKGLEEISKLYDRFHRMVTGAVGAPIPTEIGKLAVFSGVCEFPSRVKCASLAWHTLQAALAGRGEIITTEEEVCVMDEHTVPSPLRGEGEGGGDDLRQKVIETLKTCYDPEIPVNIYELGLIYDIEVNEKGSVQIQMTLTSPMCPVAGSLPPEVERKVREIPGAAGVQVNLVWDPPWQPDRMTEAARLQLGMM